MRKLYNLASMITMAAPAETGSAKAKMPQGMKPIGSGGVLAAPAGDYLLLAIPNDTRARNAAPTSKSGKTRVLATTNGFQAIPGVADVRVSLNVTLPIATA